MVEILSINVVDIEKTYKSISRSDALLLTGNTVKHTNKDYNKVP